MIERPGNVGKLPIAQPNQQTERQEMESNETVTPEAEAPAVDETESVVYVLTNEQKLHAAGLAMDRIPLEYSSTILSQDWKVWEIPTILAFVLEFEVFVSNVNELRSTLDKAIWEGHTDGTVDPQIESIRDKPSDENKRGRKAVELTPAQRALKKLGKL